MGRTIRNRKKGSAERKVSTLLSKKELEYFEELRKDTYENIDGNLIITDSNGNTILESISEPYQPRFIPFETKPKIYWPFSPSLPIGFFPCSSRFPYIYGDVLQWITTNEPEYTSASEASTDRFIKSFTSEGNFEHIVHAVEYLGARAFWCPVIIRILGYLHSINKYALYTGDRKLREDVERIAQNIGAALLHWTSKHITQKKVALLFRKLQYPKNKERKWLSSEENKLMYVKEIYEGYKKQSRGNRKEIKELKKELKQANKKLAQGIESIEQANKELRIQSTKVKGMGESPEKKYPQEKKLDALHDEIVEREAENRRWESAIQRLESDISGLKEEQEKKGNKEARKRTLEYLAKKNRC